MLLFTKTAGFAHSSIPDAVAALESTGATRGWTVTTTDDAATFTTTGLADIDVVVFLMTTGDVLDRGQQAALETFEERMRLHPEVMECYLMTGDSDYLLRVVAQDLDSFQRFLLEHLTRISGVASIKSSIALKQVSYRTALPMAHLDAAS